MNSDEEKKEEIKTVDFFGIKISLNAYIILVVGIVVSIVLILMPPYGPLAAAFVLLLVVVASYNVNCLLVGHCKIWAWVVTIVYIIFTIANIMTVYLKNKGQTSPVVDKSVFSQIKTASKMKKSSSKQ